MDTREISLQEQWEKEINKRAEGNDSSLLRDKHVVFASGIMGRELANLIGRYFPDNIEAVEKDLGGTTSYFSPSSSLSIPENSAILFEEISLIAQNKKKKLVLVGHSKGGAEFLHLVLEHPELIIFGMVEQVLLIQPAIGGSPLIDMSEGILYSLFLAIFNPNMETLSTSRAKEIFDTAFANYEVALDKIAKSSGIASKTLHEIVSSRIFYVQSKIEPEDESIGLSLVLTVLQNDLNSLEVEHDGLLPMTSQYDKRIGKILGVLKVDHLGLTVSTLSRVGKKARKAFMRLIFRITAESLVLAPSQL